jgi:hypothetical protein
MYAKLEDWVPVVLLLLSPMFHYRALPLLEPANSSVGEPVYESGEQVQGVR